MIMNVSTYLQRCVEAVTLLSPNSFSFAGNSREAADGEAMLKTLTETLYDQCYCREFDGSYRAFPPVAVDGGELSPVLTAANSTVARWEKGWVIDQLMPGGQYLATRNNRYRLVSPGEFVSAEYNPGMPQPGTAISVYCPRESANLQPAFYFAFSHEPADQPSLFTTVRFYWNLRSSGAGKLTELVTTRLNEYSIPFSFKCLNHAGWYSRIDAAVLYVAKPYFAITASLVSQIHSAIEPELGAAVPWFTKRLGPGLGLAEDPGNGESFGMSRCSMVAKGILRAGETGYRALEDKMQAVQTVFSEQGISLEEPWLNAGSKDIYEHYN